MEVTAVSIRLWTFVIVLLAARVQRSFTQKHALRMTTDRLQFFEYETVSFHCEALDGSTQLRVTSNNKEFINNCNIKRSSTLTCIFEVYETDSGEYWCESKRGERSNAVDIIVTAGSVILDSPALPVMDGDNVTLRCRKKAASISLLADFYKDDILVASSPAGETTINVDKSDEGIYKCNISGFGASPGSWLAVREVHRQTSTFLVFRAVFIVVVVALLLLLVGLLHCGTLTEITQVKFAR